MIFSCSEKIKNAGSIFIGPYAAVACGDYAQYKPCPPTAGNARALLWSECCTFTKTSTIQMIDREVLRWSDIVVRLQRQRLSAIDSVRQGVPSKVKIFSFLSYDNKWKRIRKSVTNIESVSDSRSRESRVSFQMTGTSIASILLDKQSSSTSNSNPVERRCEELHQEPLS